MADTIRLKLEQRSDEDHGPQFVRDPEGYEWHFAPNQTHVIPVLDPRTLQMSGNATVALGQPTQQTYAPNIVVDTREQPAII